MNTTTFLQRLRPGGPWRLVAIDPDRQGPIRGCRATTAAEVEQFIAVHWRRNLYYHVNRCHRGAWVKATKDDISVVEYLHADCDPARGESPASARSRYAAALSSSGLPTPSFLIDSGGGAQALWRIPPVTVVNSDDPVILRIEATCKAVMQRLGAPTGTQDISRIFRLPESINWKRSDGRSPRRTRVISSSGGVYSLDQFPQPRIAIRPESTIEESADYGAALERFRAALKTLPAQRQMWLRVHLLKTRDLAWSDGVDRSDILRRMAFRLKDLGLSEGEAFILLWKSGWCKFRTQLRRQRQQRRKMDKEKGPVG